MTANPHRPRRRGLTSAVVLVILLIIGLLGVALLRVALARRSEARVEERKLQAESLIDAALDRASARLEQAPDYTGETWEIPAAEFGDRGPGRVTIQVEPVADAPTRRKLNVQAIFPAGSPGRARRSRSLVLELRPPTAEEPRP